jgi:hypothetical protein
MKDFTWQSVALQHDALYRFLLSKRTPAADVEQ